MISRFEHAGGKWEGWDANDSVSATMSRSGPKGDIAAAFGHIRSTPESGRRSAMRESGDRKHWTVPPVDFFFVQR